ncbi:MAG: ATP-binding protein [Kiritimatiellae bacterium]|nr:ATP-binding protein [Kiritimatiellia bacterium]
MLESELERIIEDQTAESTRKKTLARDDLARIRTVPDFALIVTGVRRCGKSTLLRQWAAGQGEKTLSLLFDDLRMTAFTADDFAVLDRIVDSRRPANLVFDEIQLVDGWERYVKLKLDQGYRVLVTGSNASMLSSELGTHLTGRHLDLELGPFSYREFLRFTGMEPSPESVLSYLERGGFPAYLETDEPEVLRQLVRDIVNRDIAVRHGTRDVRPLETLAAFLLANSGNRVTPSKLAGALGVKSPSTVLAWFDHFEKTYLVERLERFSDSAKSRALAPKKVYAVDTALPRVAASSRTRDAGRALETAVWREIKRKSGRLNYWADDMSECDFVWSDASGKFQALQVCLELGDENRGREFRGLLGAMRQLGLDEGTIVTLRQSDFACEDGRRIRIVPAHEWFAE